MGVVWIWRFISHMFSLILSIHNRKSPTTAPSIISQATEVGVSISVSFNYSLHLYARFIFHPPLEDKGTWRYICLQVSEWYNQYWLTKIYRVSYPYSNLTLATSKSYSLRRRSATVSCHIISLLFHPFFLCLKLFSLTGHPYSFTTLLPTVYTLPSDRLLHSLSPTRYSSQLPKHEWKHSNRWELFNLLLSLNNMSRQLAQHLVNLMDKLGVDRYGRIIWTDYKLILEYKEKINAIVQKWNGKFTSIFSS